MSYRWFDNFFLNIPHYILLTCLFFYFIFFHLEKKSNHQMLCLAFIFDRIITFWNNWIKLFDVIAARPLDRVRGAVKIRTHPNCAELHYICELFIRIQTIEFSEKINISKTKYIMHLIDNINLYLNISLYFRACCEAHKCVFDFQLLRRRRRAVPIVRSSTHFFAIQIVARMRL